MRKKPLSSYTPHGNRCSFPCIVIFYILKRGLISLWFLFVGAEEEIFVRVSAAWSELGRWAASAVVLQLPLSPVTHFPSLAPLTPRLSRPFLLYTHTHTCSLLLHPQPDKLMHLSLKNQSAPISLSSTLLFSRSSHPVIFLQSVPSLTFSKLPHVASITDANTAQIQRLEGGQRVGTTLK